MERQALRGRAPLLLSSAFARRRFRPEHCGPFGCAQGRQISATRPAARSSIPALLRRCRRCRWAPGGRQPLKVGSEVLAERVCDGQVDDQMFSQTRGARNQGHSPTPAKGSRCSTWPTLPFGSAAPVLPSCCTGRGPALIGISGDSRTLTRLSSFPCGGVPRPMLTGPPSGKGRHVVRETIGVGCAGAPRPSGRPGPGWVATCAQPSLSPPNPWGLSSTAQSYSPDTT